MTAPRFPGFKPLALEDQSAVESFVENFPPYSDFDFASLWAWNVSGDCAWSMRGGNLIVVLRDYLAGSPCLTVLGRDDLPDTAEELLDYSLRRGWGPSLRLVPETTAECLDGGGYIVEADRDSFDYLYRVADHVGYLGHALKTHRTNLRAFERRYGPYRVAELDCSDSRVIDQVEALWRRWQSSAANALNAEFMACRRLLAASERFRCRVTGIILSGELIAFDVTALSGCSCANSLFAKADVRFSGVYSVLQHEVSKRLLDAGYTKVNFEQDLGLPGLRRAKLSFRPESYLRKYTVTRPG